MSWVNLKKYSSVFTKQQYLLYLYKYAKHKENAHSNFNFHAANRLIKTWMKAYLKIPFFNAQPAIAII